VTENKPSSGSLVLSTNTEFTVAPEWGGEFKAPPILAPTVISNDRGSLTLETTPKLVNPGDWYSILTSITQTPTGLSISVGRDLARELPLEKRLMMDVPDRAEVAKRAYPHLLEAAQPAIALVEGALQDARAALESYGEGDFDGIGSRLSLIAAQCAEAHEWTTFNESFGAVVSFVRRASIAADVTQIGRNQLNGLILSLTELVSNPMIDLAHAGDLVTALSEGGWEGEDDSVRRLIAEILGDAEAERLLLEVDSSLDEGRPE
jgi:hypothetical protein